MTMDLKEKYPKLVAACSKNPVRPLSSIEDRGGYLNKKSTVPSRKGDGTSHVGDSFLDKYCL